MFTYANSLLLRVSPCMGLIFSIGDISEESQLPSSVRLIIPTSCFCSSDSDRRSTVKYLGVILYSKLSSEGHLDYSAKKLTGK